MIDKQKYNIKELRGYSIALIIEYFRKNQKKKLNFFEIGSAYSKNQGISTAQLADFCYQGGHDFSTVDIAADHTEACKAIVREVCGLDVEKNTTFYTSDSLDALKDLKSRKLAIDFAYIDGGNDPLQNLKEFQLITEMLSPEGIILVDDLQEINAPDGYQAPRPMGKASLIVPYLILAQHKKHDAPIGFLRDFDSTFDVKNFFIQIRMLAYGPDEFLNYYKNSIKKSGTKTGIHF